VLVGTVARDLGEHLVRSIDGDSWGLAPEHAWICAWREAWRASVK
jgi:hypothetical protein